MGPKIQGAKKLYAAWVVVFFILVLMTVHYNVETTTFQGIAETDEVVVNSEAPVEIFKINVIGGQTVKQGAKLVELINSTLAIKISNISHQLEQLKMKKTIDKSEINSKINKLRAEKRTKINEINFLIRQFENQDTINRELSKDLKSIQFQKDKISAARNPIEIRIEMYNEEIANISRFYNVQLDMYKKMLNNSESPVKIQIDRFEKELALLRKQNSELDIYAKFDGIIGAINFKPGENVAPFTPILTILRERPSFVKGYIHENISSKIKIGDKVKVFSLVDSRKFVHGRIAGIGNRIVSFPVRLLKHKDYAVWGQEVTVKIVDSNSFTLGEKLMISASETDSFSAVKYIFSYLFSKEAQAGEMPGQEVEQ